MDGRSQAQLTSQTSLLNPAAPLPQEEAGIAPLRQVGAPGEKSLPESASALRIQLSVSRGPPELGLVQNREEPRSPVGDLCTEAQEKRGSGTF